MSYFPSVDRIQLRVLKLVAGENLPEGLMVNNKSLYTILISWFLHTNLIIGLQC